MTEYLLHYNYKAAWLLNKPWISTIIHKMSAQTNNVGEQIIHSKCKRRKHMLPCPCHEIAQHPDDMTIWLLLWERSQGGICGLPSGSCNTSCGNTTIRPRHVENCQWTSLDSLHCLVNNHLAELRLPGQKCHSIELCSPLMHISTELEKLQGTGESLCKNQKRRSVFQSNANSLQCLSVYDVFARVFLVLKACIRVSSFMY